MKAGIFPGKVIIVENGRYMPGSNLLSVYYRKTADRLIRAAGTPWEI